MPDPKELFKFLKEDPMFWDIVKRIESCREYMKNPDSDALEHFAYAMVSECADRERVLSNPDEKLYEAYEKFRKEYERTGLPSPEFVEELLAELGDEYYQE